MLADWLLAPAAADAIIQRQEAVRELAARPAWRERLALAGDDLPAGLDTAAVAAWGAANAGPPAQALRRVATVIVIVSLAAMGGWSMDWWPISVPAAALMVQIGFAATLVQRVRTAVTGLRGRSRDLFHLAGLLACVETESFTAPRLRELQSQLTIGGKLPSRRLGELARLIGWLDATRDQLFGLIAPFLMWTTPAPPWQFSIGAAPPGLLWGNGWRSSPKPKPWRRWPPIHSRIPVTSFPNSDHPNRFSMRRI